MNKEERPQGFEECGKLTFAPTISAAPDTTTADSPAGLSVEVKEPQEGLTGSESGLYFSKVRIAPADLKNTTVVLPEGMVINPGQASGLTACQSSEDGVGTEGRRHARARRRSAPMKSTRRCWLIR